jgi:peptide/nickel transport system permease protein
MLRLVITRIATAVAVLLAVSVVVFFGVSVLPGNAAEIQLGQSATPERVAALSEQYGLDRPIHERYVDWLGGLLQGDLGQSLTSGQPVSTLIGDNLENSAVLAGLAILIVVPLAVVLGILSALWRDKLLDHSIAVTSLAFLSTPEFAVGTLLITVFATGLGLFPPVAIIGSDSIFSQLDVLFLPVLTLVLVAVGQATRMIRAAMIEVLDQDYIEAAMLRGVPRRTILFRHALPNAFDSSIQVIALTVGWLVGGVVVTETLFQFPGIGSAFATAVDGRDLQTVEAAAMIVTAVYVTANLLSDLAIIIINPRLRRGHG